MIDQWIGEYRIIGTVLNIDALQPPNLYFLSVTFKLLHLPLVMHFTPEE